MLIEEEKQRIPIAQGLPWTTDEPEVSCSLKVNDSYTNLLKLYNLKKEQKKERKKKKKSTHAYTGKALEGEI